MFGCPTGPRRADAVPACAGCSGHRDTAQRWPTKGQFVARVGTFDDLFYGRNGQYRINSCSHAGSDNADSGLEVLPHGTIVATNYIKYQPGPEKHFVVSPVQARRDGSVMERNAMETRRSTSDPSG